MAVLCAVGACAALASASPSAGEQGGHQRGHLPTASFIFTPATPLVDETVTFQSTSAPAQGVTITALAWTVSGEGVSMSGSGSTYTTAFPAPGVYVVTLTATDEDGQSSTTEQAVTVAPGPQSPPPQAPPPPPPPPPGQSRALLMQPFPIVTVAGRLTRGGARLQLLSVLAPVGARISVRCAGRGCPRRARVVVAAASGHAGTLTALVRFRRFERALPAGARLIVTVTAPGEIGKYTSLHIRRGAPPRRADLCMMPAQRLPRGCPS